jgi:hypothetical protein
MGDKAAAAANGRVFLGAYNGRNDPGNILCRSVRSPATLLVPDGICPSHSRRIGGIESSFVTSFQDLWFKLAVQERYKLSLFLRLLSRSLRGIAVRPLPCNYYVIQ